MIPEKTLKKWRREALEGISPDMEVLFQQLIDSQKCILRMTQELLDLHLVIKEKK